MLGYVTPERPELKVREYDLYQGYYCGICKSIGRRYGQLPRMTLSYDSVFLALILSSLNDEKEKTTGERCLVHPLKKRTVVQESSAVDYAADLMLILAYYKLRDDYEDEHQIKGALGSALMKNIFKNLMKTHEKKGIIIKNMLSELSDLEHAKCISLDQVAEPFAKLMEEVFSVEGEKEELLRRIGYHLGKWIYLVDAFDDIEENAESGSYNPLICQFGFPNAGADEGPETTSAFRDRVRERVEYNLLYYLGELAEAYQKLEAKKNQGLIENIVYLGLLRKTEQVLEKGRNDNDAESI